MQFQKRRESEDFLKYLPALHLKKMNAEAVMIQIKPECELKESCTETDFNEDDRSGMKEKMKKQRCFEQSKNKRPFSHQISSVNRNKNYTDLKDVFQEVRNKKQLAVRCGKMLGCLYRIKYNNGEKCISCKGEWFTPKQFEELGGKGHHKKWKSSIYYNPSNGFQQMPLEKLILNGCLSDFGQLRKSIRLVTQTDRDDANSVENVTRNNESINSLKGFPESWKRLFSKTLEIPVCGIEEKSIQPAHTDSSSDESVSVAKRVKMNRRESVNLAETVGKKMPELVESPGDSSSPPTDATEPAVSPVIDEADQTTDEEAAEWQNPVVSEETEKTGQMQLFEFLANQFSAINNTLQSIDLSLKKLVEKQSQNTLPQYFSLTPAVIENPRIHSSVKEEQMMEVLNN
ncbi:uncharacterized protein LOC113046755 isoform X1 [Carassius auratus]|uniref:Uncharacterized protein LOC113046755 isoform X1 n=2 Tax=Carassius auratus TaxID=7957 RepID=A0A6P6JUE2_CARAU|nr:uncharacterized protein LOC113046755 isoform X1 [Carassius auratus]